MPTLTKPKYQFELEQSPSKKGVCPNCKKQGCFRYYKSIPKDYGICDHKNNCGYHNDPFKQSIDIKNQLLESIDKKPVAEKTQATKKIIYPDISKLAVLNSLNSIFHGFCTNTLNIPIEHLQRWNVGTDANGNTAFVFQTVTGKQLNIKFMNYVLTNNGKDCKRNKNRVPFSLKAKENEQYKICLFGEHLLTNKIICLVESEKTAVVCSYFYPQYDWLATGGSNGLTVEKVQILKDKEVYYLSDNDKAGKENSTLKKLEQYGINFKKVVFQNAADGEDLADLVIRGERPIIKPLDQNDTSDQKQKTEVKKNLSEYEKVENFISERYEVRNNVISNKIEYREINSENIEFKELNENNIFRELQKNFINFSINKLKSMLGSDFVKEYNPFKNYFESLPAYDPNKESDYILSLTNYIPVKDKERLQTQFKKMLVRCIACSLFNVVNKQAFVLVHDQQNSGKTTFLRWLNPPDLKGYIAENISTDKDSLIAMCTNFFINMDELATLNKAEINALKSIMSKDVFKGRLPYGAREVNLIRRANIVGSTNNTEFLNDETGSVRWLCFELTDKLNFDYKKDIDINRVWAQAYYLLNNGFKYELTPQEVAENELANANHRIITIEQELIQATFEPGNKGESTSNFKNSTDIKRHLDHIYPGERLNITVIGKALKILRFTQVSEKPPNSRYSIKGYYVKLKTL